MNPQTKPAPATQAAPQPKQKAADLLSLVSDETLRRQLEQQIVDEFIAQRESAVINVPPPQVEIKIRYGRAFGFNEVQSIQWVYLFETNGKMNVTIDYKGRAFLLKRAGYDWRQVDWTNTVAEFQFYRDGVAITTADGKPLRIKWTIEDAQKAGLVQRARGKGNTEAEGTYDKYPRRMLFAKVLHDFAAVFAQEVSGGTTADVVDQVEEKHEMIMPEEETNDATAS